MSQLIHPDVLGKPFFPSIRQELNRRKSLNQISYGSNSISNPILWQPYFVMRRIQKNYAQDEKVSPSTFVSGRFSELGKIKTEDYDIGEGISDIVSRGGEFRQTVGITNVSVDQEGFVYYTINVGFHIPNIDDFGAFRKMWLIHAAPCEIEFGRVVPIEFNITDIDASPYKQKFNAIIATFSYTTGASGRSVSGDIKMYTASNLLALFEASAKTKDKNQFQGHVMDRIKGDHHLYGKPTKTARQQNEEMEKKMKKRTNRPEEEVRQDIADFFGDLNDQTYIGLPATPVGIGVIANDPILQGLPETDTGLPVGIITAKKESNMDASAIGTESDGTNSYGAFQFKNENAKKFVNQSPYASDFAGLEPSTPAFSKKWKEVAQRDNAQFYKHQYKYATIAFYKPTETLAKSKGINTSDRGIAEFLFSMSINHGARGQEIIMDNAIASAGSSPTSAEFIDHLKNARINYIKGLPSIDTGTENSLIDRYEDEARISRSLSSGEDIAVDLGGRTSPTGDPIPETDFSDNPYKSDTRAFVDSQNAELIYIPVNATTANDKEGEWKELQKNGGAFTDESGNKRVDTRHGTQSLPEGYVAVKDLGDIKANFAEAIEATIATFRLDSNIFGTELYYYVSVYAIEKMVNDYLNKFYQNSMGEEAPQVKIDLSSVKVRDLKPLGLPMTSIFPEIVLFNPHKLEGEENENTLKTVYISAQYLYDLTNEREIGSPFLFVEAIIEIINHATA